MDPQSCTAILLKQAEDPFYILDNEEEKDLTVNLLSTMFGHVYKETSLESCMKHIKSLSSSSTILLLDFDNSITPKCQVEMITQAVNRLSETTIPIVACSTIDDSNFMIECIQAGAADYVLHPLRPDVIKTLFLALYRHQKMDLYQDHRLMYSSTTLSTSSVMSPTTPTTLPTTSNHNSVYLPDNIHERMKHLITKDINFTKVILDTYTTPFMNNSTTQSFSIELTSEHKENLKGKVSSWDFCPLSLSHQDLIHCVVIILNQVFLLPGMHPMNQEQLYDFVIDLSNLYHDDNPYHNFFHAVDVLQCIYYFLCQINLLPFADHSTIKKPKDDKRHCILRSIDIFALLIAAIGHDTGHPGVNNAFLISTSSPLALLYNDRSVLESFHAMTLFQLLKKHGFDTYLGGVESSQYKEFRKLVITSILATDMSLHCDYVAKIKEQTKRLMDSHSTDWDEARIIEERLLFCSGLMKCADISNVARPFPRAFEWAQILVEEFACQGDLERELGLPVLPMNDRSKIVLEDSQIGFIKFIALGLFESIHGYMQDLSFPVEHIKKNLSVWEERKKELIDKEHEIIEETTIVQSATTIVEDDKDYRLALNNNGESETEYKLPVMPPVAMTSLSHVYPKETTHQNETTIEDDWHPSSSSGPVYCQCIIQ
ncbi:hypothetical protein G6F57_004231 [Rhizopus arrhizus]|uniref:Phosphodiesterase n=1 Tax=Rhizopus oryzae TaxID=64495 RepID=A0A9P6XIS5_RHIOR|nr:hypothetical protein G6F23_001758 [Rhizopus arrhizus]KAG1420216.1 hypothetical protein G6F58_004280 [Rhizopus delemar]KAG0767349.1 hypothetical protein G6F24_002869 [Rhizopus arrhizus]KAG0792830.1 hypothetical protein G6F21_004068 [Rhizopus arrhizus]KAG0793156.1 hypothetical protein G6F22_005678 [Rhizopus arrhizus]